MAISFKDLMVLIFPLILFVLLFGLEQYFLKKNTLWLFVSFSLLLFVSFFLYPIYLLVLHVVASSIFGASSIRDTVDWILPFECFSVVAVFSVLYYYLAKWRCRTIKLSSSDERLTKIVSIASLGCIALGTSAVYLLGANISLVCFFLWIPLFVLLFAIEHYFIRGKIWLRLASFSLFFLLNMFLLAVVTLFVLGLSGCYLFCL
ncbi:MAG: hypothetical protein M0P12_10180 [Paludibacteraceae bacterium]|nr:hypothetical protein [Paludibacteraceae bacterium]